MFPRCRSGNYGLSLGKTGRGFPVSFIGDVTWERVIQWRQDHFNLYTWYITLMLQLNLVCFPRVSIKIPCLHETTLKDINAVSTKQRKNSFRLPTQARIPFPFLFSHNTLPASIPIPKPLHHRPAVPHTNTSNLPVHTSPSTTARLKKTQREIQNDDPVTTGNKETYEKPQCLTFLPA